MSRLDEIRDRLRQLNHCEPDDARYLLRLVVELERVIEQSTPPIHLAAALERIGFARERAAHFDGGEP